LAIQEVRSGDSEVSQKRFMIIDPVPLLKLNPETLKIANGFVTKSLVPKKNVEDALHIAVATVHGIDYLLTWNCKHIANAEMQRKLTTLCNANG